MPFYICKTCGNSEINHNFRHLFEGTILVKDKEIKTENMFTLNATDFPLVTQSYCAISNCGKPKNFHNVEVPEIMRTENDLVDARKIKHDFLEHKVSYRNIQFAVPLDTNCRHFSCYKSLENHFDEENHIFTTHVEIENLQENDKINIFNPHDEDNKIIWKKSIL